MIRLRLPLSGRGALGGLALLALGLSGCASPVFDRTGPAASAPPGAAPSRRPAVIVKGSRQVVEEYLRAASEADGAAMYALLATSERDDETPKTLGKTAQDRYSSGMQWEVLKTEENENSAEVVVDFKGAKVDPNPTRFTLTRESGEWRIVDSPELNEREKDGRIRIKL